MKPPLMNPNAPSNDENPENLVAIDGFQQIVEMLRIADKDFRESLLKRLAAKDRRLVQNLRRDLD